MKWIKGKCKIVVFERWIIALCDEEIGKYYRNLYSLEYFYKDKVQRPIWGSHISIVRGEKQVDNKTKSCYNNKEFEFLWSPKVLTNGVHFWLPCRSPIFDLIRFQVGLGKPIVDYHLSFGNIVLPTGRRKPEKYYGF